MESKLKKRLVHCSSHLPELISPVMGASGELFRSEVRSCLSLSLMMIPSISSSSFISALRSKSTWRTVDKPGNRLSVLTEEGCPEPPTLASSPPTSHSSHKAENSSSRILPFERHRSTSYILRIESKLTSRRVSGTSIDQKQADKLIQRTS